MEVEALKEEFLGENLQEEQVENNRMCRIKLRNEFKPLSVSHLSVINPDHLRLKGY